MVMLNDFAARFRHGHASASPFTRLGLDWCPRCKMVAETEMRARHEGVTYAYKRICLRCGKVIIHGIYHHVPLLSQVPVPQAMQTWVTMGGADRRSRSEHHSDPGPVIAQPGPLTTRAIMHKKRG